MIWNLGLCNELISPEMKKERTIVLMKSQMIKYRDLLYWHGRCQLKLQTNNFSWYACLLASILLLLVTSFSISSSFLSYLKAANAQPITLKDMKNRVIL